MKKFGVLHHFFFFHKAQIIRNVLGGQYIGGPIDCSEALIQILEKLKIEDAKVNYFY